MKSKTPPCGRPRYTPSTYVPIFGSWDGAQLTCPIPRRKTLAVFRDTPETLKFMFGVSRVRSVRSSAARSLNRSPSSAVTGMGTSWTVSSRRRAVTTSSSMTWAPSPASSA